MQLLLELGVLWYFQIDLAHREDVLQADLWHASARQLRELIRGLDHGVHRFQLTQEIRLQDLQLNVQSQVSDQILRHHFGRGLKHIHQLPSTSHLLKFQQYQL